MSGPGGGKESILMPKSGETSIGFIVPAGNIYSSVSSRVLPDINDFLNKANELNRSVQDQANRQTFADTFISIQIR